MPPPFRIPLAQPCRVGAPYAYSDNPGHHTAYTLQYMLNIQRQFGETGPLKPGIWGR